ncbi:MAG: hypothetical protein Q9O62_14950 [Ardenticatenia bacterium]|nr:hypothetical protein [Ardenticatenia bacterium]
MHINLFKIAPEDILITQSVDSLEYTVFHEGYRPDIPLGYNEANFRYVELVQGYEEQFFRMMPFRGRDGIWGAIIAKEFYREMGYTIDPEIIGYAQAVSEDIIARLREFMARSELLGGAGALYPGLLPAVSPAVPGAGEQAGNPALYPGGFVYQ